ncbi:MAG: hypothetical protein Q4P31_06355 [Andreesenia angusta]|nr:hypothetical protein [Andreesenia angusta]
MQINFLIKITFILLVLSILGYIISVLKEKISLIQGTIVLKNIKANQDTINKIDSIEMELKNKLLRTGDEVKLKLFSGKVVKGIVIGFSEEENKTLFMNTKTKLKEVKFKDIRKVKIISKYGKFFSF